MSHVAVWILLHIWCEISPCSFLFPSSPSSCSFSLPKSPPSLTPSVRMQIPCIRPTIFNADRSFYYLYPHICIHLCGLLLSCMVKKNTMSWVPIQHRPEHHQSHLSWRYWPYKPAQNLVCGLWNLDILDIISCASRRLTMMTIREDLKTFSDCFIFLKYYYRAVHLSGLKIKKYR